ncbi:DUF2243 domain-containing protein [Glycomyces tarimensis]
MNDRSDPQAEAPHDRVRSLLATGVIGVGVMAGVDEIVFHQILGWHHFYDPSTSDVALLSDGLLHAGELIALTAGFFWFADLRRRGVLDPRFAWAGFLIGSGAFQLLDGIVNHKVLRLHQIRYGVELWPYDLAWNLFGAVLLLTGAALAVASRASDRSRRRAG